MDILLILKDLGKEYIDAGKIANEARKTLKESSKLKFYAPKQVASGIGMAAGGPIGAAAASGLSSFLTKP